MALYLVTGQPGHGKTAYAIDRAFQMQKEGRTIYAHGIKDFDYERAGWKYLDDPTQWEALPDGSVVILDECYTIFPNRNPGAKVPAHVEALARHRHRGFDFILIAQQGLQLDPFMRGLYEEHVHVRQTSLFKSKTKLKRWNQYQGNVQVQCADVVDWVRPAYVFGYYTSTTLVTTKRNLPTWMRNILIGLGIIGLVSFYLYRSYSEKLNPEGHSSTASSQGAGSTATFGGTPGVAGESAPKWANAYEYATAHLPRIGAMPWTAPIYDQRSAVTDPQLICMSSPGGPDAQGIHKDASCTCVTEQGTAYDLSQPECRTIARRGPAYNPYKQVQPVNAQPVPFQPRAEAVDTAGPSVQFTYQDNKRGDVFPRSPGYDANKSGLPTL
jgi:zona occludens toxin